MAEGDLSAVWNVLQTEAAGEVDAIEAVDAPTRVNAGQVLLGVDGSGRRHVLIPLLPGEAFAPDGTGRSVHLIRVTHCGIDYLSAVCLHEDLHKVFAQFAWELLGDIEDSPSPARTTIEALQRWRRLFADAEPTDELSVSRIIGLMAELLVLEEILAADPNREVRVWTGPQSAGSEHDFRHRTTAIEVKGTLVREGRIVGISSLDQLEPPPDGSLHLAHFRFEPDSSGVSLPTVVSRLRALCPEQAELDNRLSAAGYRDSHAEAYADLQYTVVERRTYNVESPAFPRIVASSFAGGAAPAGTLRIRYSIDLTNEPPHPINAAEHAELIRQMVVN
jgi:hypothetical protein